MSKKYRRYKKEGSYSVVSVVSYLIRQFCLPNPFTNMFNPGEAEIANWICGGIFVGLAYFLTGTWYVSKKGDYWKGSLGFFINYVILTGLILLISNFIANIYVVCVVFIIIYVLLCIVESNVLKINNISF